MKICFPVRKQNGSQYSTLDEVMGLIGREPHGSWLAGTNQLWHGGIHISQASAPGSVLTADNADSAVPLQCMARGEVVAWRLNQVYKTADYNGKELKYSSTFVLVKSLCKPDPAKENSWLEFYTLYMGLAPLSAFSKAKCFKAKTDGLRKRIASNFESSTSSDGIPEAPAKKGSLKKDERVIVQKQQNFRNSGTVQPFGLAKKLDANGVATGDAFWITLLPEFMEPDGEQYAQMPVWMQKAVEQGAFDSVTKPAATIEIEAGEAIGFLGEDIAPAGKSNVNTCHYAHIEVISTDSRMPEFLNNPAGITTGQRYIQILQGKSLYQRTGEGDDSSFVAMSCIVLKDGGKILPRDKCNPFEDKDGKTWFEVSPRNWMSQDDVKELHQFDLKELGFTTLEEEPSPDVSKSLREDWVKGAYDWMSQRVGKERGIQQKQVSAFYTNLIKKIDADGDGELSGAELYNALHHPELGLRDIAARLIVKHDSEWSGGSSHHRWNVFFQNYDSLRVAYAKQWLDDCEWMSQVDAFKKGEPVWHFHPVMFLSALQTEEDCAKLIWGEVVNQRLGAAKACQFRKKVIKICAEMWGETEKVRYADVLMGCISVETNRMFSSSVIAYRKARHKNGEVIFVSGQSGPRPKIELHAFTRDEIIKDNSLVEQNAVGLIQFTSVALQQINITNNMSLTKLQLALMDEIEQLDYVKLYFTSNKDKFEQIKTPEDVYTYIFCPEGVGKPDDAVLYSKVDNERAYRMNASLDSTEHGNKGNNDGLIQKRELLVRLNSLMSEGEKYRNQCDCIGKDSDEPEWMPVALSEFGQYKNLVETDSELNDKIKIYHNTTNARGSDGSISWCSSFVNWCLMQTKYAPLATHSALAYSWGQGTWQNGEVVDKPFYGAIAVMNYSHVGFVCGINPDGRLLILGGNQGGGRVGTANCISIRANSASSIKYLMKPKGYNVRPVDYELKVINVSGPSSSYSDTH